jgi:nucleotide-binding universal stress UspA family protein
LSWRSRAPLRQMLILGSGGARLRYTREETEMSIFPTKILLATDGSGDAELALSTAVDLANNNDSELHVVTVERGLPTEGSHEDEAAAQDAGQLLEEQAEKAGGTVAQTHLKKGERPDREILRLAEEIDAGLIVMGSKGLGEIEEALLGTVADSVVRHAHCPVLVVRGDRQLASSRCWPTNPREWSTPYSGRKVCAVLPLPP